jgi:hypothetical protein
VGPVDKLADSSPMPGAIPCEYLDITALLRSLPILTDQGKALQSFVTKWLLTWFICH